MAGIRNRLGGAALNAVHVNHGLQPEANAWACHCVRICESLHVSLKSLSVTIRRKPGESLEAIARGARYAAMKGLLEEGEVLLTAHHQDDQAETLLLQLLRGAGPRGLSGMPECARLGLGWLSRPLLQVPRDALRQYAALHSLDWIEDQSNSDHRFPRNYLRQMISPRLEARWPSFIQSLSRAALLQADAARLMDDLAAMDLKYVVGSTKDTLSCRRLSELSPARQRNVLTIWIRGLGLSVPGHAQIAHILSDVLEADADTSPLVRWRGGEIRRYRDSICAMEPLTSLGDLRPLPWTLCAPLELPHGNLEAALVNGQGLSKRFCPDSKAEVRFRRGGERCKPVGRAHSQLLKKLFQEYGVPPWQRDRLPLIYINNTLGAVAGLWICSPFAAAENEAGWVFRWASMDRHIRRWVC